MTLLSSRRQTWTNTYCNTSTYRTHTSNSCQLKIIQLYLPYIPNTQNTSNSPPFQWPPSMVSTCIYVVLTFSLRPDEATSVWRHQNLFFKNVIYCFVSVPRRFHIIDYLWQSSSCWWKGRGYVAGTPRAPWRLLSLWSSSNCLEGNDWGVWLHLWGVGPLCWGLWTLESPGTQMLHRITGSVDPSPLKTHRSE